MARTKNTPNAASEAQAPEAEAPQAEAQEAPAPEAQAEAPAPKAEKSDEQKAQEKAQREADAAEAEANLRTSIDEALQGGVNDEGHLPTEAAEQLQGAYRKIAAGARGRVQAEILREKMTQDGVDMQALAAVLEVMTQAPATKAKSTRVAKPARPAHELVAEGLTVLALAQRTLLDSLESDDERTQAREASKAALQGEVADDDEREALLGRVSRVIRSANPKSRASGGSGGERVMHKDSLKDIFDRGDLAEGAVLQHGDVTASIDGEGKIVVNGESFENPTAAATAVLKAQGKTTTVNGWAWWNVVQGDNSTPLGDLRKA